MCRIKSKLMQAAELRAVGHPWEEVAEKLHTKKKTCMNWTSTYSALWRTLYREAQDRRFEQTANECHTYLANMARSKDPKLRDRAIFLMLRYGAQAWGRNGTMIVEAPSGPPSVNADIHARLCQAVDEAREAINRKRAQEGKPPPATDAEFMAAWKAEVQAMPPRKEPMPVYFDKEGNSIEPPGEAADSRPHEPSGTSPSNSPGHPVTRDMVWGVLLLVSLLGRTPVSRDAEALRSGAREPGEAGATLVSNEPSVPGRHGLAICV